MPSQPSPSGILLPLQAPKLQLEETPKRHARQHHVTAITRMKVPLTSASAHLSRPALIADRLHVRRSSESGGKLSTILVEQSFSWMAHHCMRSQLQEPRGGKTQWTLIMSGFSLFSRVTTPFWTPVKVAQPSVPTWAWLRSTFLSVHQVLTCAVMASAVLSWRLITVPNLEDITSPWTKRKSSWPKLDTSVVSSINTPQYVDACISRSVSLLTTAASAASSSDKIVSLSYFALPAKLRGDKSTPGKTFNDCHLTNATFSLAIQ